MVDYSVPTGGSGSTRGRLVIRDNGSNYIELLVQAAYVGTFRDNLPCNWVVNGSAGSATPDYPTGMPLLLVAAFTVTTTQTVTWGIGASGTSGLGGPTSFSQPINRATIPAAPTSVTPVDITHTGMTYEFNDNSNGGSAITSRQYMCSTSPTFVGATWQTAPSDGIVTLDNLIPGTKYYWKARVINAVGPSTASTTVSATTLSGMKVKHDGAIRDAVPYVKVGEGLAYPAVTQVKLAEGLFPTAS